MRYWRGVVKGGRDERGCHSCYHGDNREGRGGRASGRREGGVVVGRHCRGNRSHAGGAGGMRERGQREGEVKGERRQAQIEILMIIEKDSKLYSRWSGYLLLLRPKMFLTDVAY